MNPNSAKIAFTSDDGTVETLWAEPVGNDVYRLDNTPFYFYGVSYQDMVVATAAADGMLEFRRLHSKGGHRTVRVLTPPTRLHERAALLAAISERGATSEGAFEELLAVDVPPSSDLKSVCDYLTDNGWEWEHADPTYEQLHAT